MGDRWAAGGAYEAYMGRWSSLVAADFLTWVGTEPGLRWLDVGCGAGALTAAVVERQDPASAIGVDPSADFLAHARGRVGGRGVAFAAGDARALPVRDASVDVAVSGLALNFVPDAARAAAELLRATAPGGVVAAYVWDYSGGMQMLAHFWRAATALDPGAAPLDEANRFATWDGGRLRDLLSRAGAARPAVEELVVTTRFRDFHDYWEPFLGGQGPAPSYVAGLPEPARRALEESLRAQLPTDADGSIGLTARAWAVRVRREGPS